MRTYLEQRPVLLRITDNGHSSETAVLDGWLLVHGQGYTGMLGDEEYTSTCGPDGLHLGAIQDELFSRFLPPIHASDLHLKVVFPSMTHLNLFHSSSYLLFLKPFVETPSLDLN